jgi:ferredoxin
VNLEHALKGWLRKLTGTGAPAPDAAVVGPDMVVTPDASRCIQCGVCGYNCPVGIPVRDFARQGRIVDDPRCVQCGRCVEVCPRGTLRWAPHPQPQSQPLLELEAQLLADGIFLTRRVPEETDERR